MNVYINNPVTIVKSIVVMHRRQKLTLKMMLPPPFFKCGDGVLNIMSSIEFQGKKLHFGLIRLENFLHLCWFSFFLYFSLMAFFLPLFHEAQLCRVCRILFFCEQHFHPTVDLSIILVATLTVAHWFLWCGDSGHISPVMLISVPGWYLTKCGTLGWK